MTSVVKIVRSASFGRRRRDFGASSGLQEVLVQSCAEGNSYKLLDKSKDEIAGAAPEVTPADPTGPISLMKAVVRTASFSRRRERTRSASFSHRRNRARSQDADDSCVTKDAPCRTPGKTTDPWDIKNMAPAQQSSLMEAMGMNSSPLPQPVDGNNGDQRAWLEQQVHQIRSEQKLEQFQERIQHTKQMRDSTAAQPFEDRVQKMKRCLPKGLPPDHLPPPPSGTTLRNGIGYNEGVYVVDASTLYRRDSMEGAYEHALDATEASDKGESTDAADTYKHNYLPEASNASATYLRNYEPVVIKEDVDVIATMDRAADGSGLTANETSSFTEPFAFGNTTSTMTPLREQQLGWLQNREMQCAFSPLSPDVLHVSDPQAQSLTNRAPPAPGVTGYCLGAVFVPHPPPRTPEPLERIRRARSMHVQQDLHGVLRREPSTGAFTRDPLLVEPLKAVPIRVART